MRKMRRFKQLMSMEQNIEVLDKGTHGVMAIMADDDYPYAVPINYVYDQQNNCIYFHGAMSGMREEYMAKNVKCSFCVVDLDQNDPEHYSTFFRSVIAFGTTRVLKEGKEFEDALYKLTKKFVSEVYEDEAILKQIDLERPTCLVTVIDIDFITGKEAIELVKARKAK